MKYYLNLICVCCLLSVAFVACQPMQEDLQVNDPLAEMEVEIMKSEASDINARKGHRNRFGTFMSGREEVPPPTDATGSGAAFFELVDGGTAIAYEVRAANTDNIVAAHIHLAPLGVPGPVVINLMPSSSSGVIAQGKFTEANLVGPLAGADFEDLIKAMRDGNTYVNVHTIENPPGEIRGQISEIQPNDNGNYAIRLSGDQEVPSVMTKAKGAGIFKFNADNSVLSFQVNVANLEDVRAAHIHIGKANTNGPVVVFLRGDKVWGPVNGVYAKGEIVDSNLIGLLGGGDLVILREAIRTGNAYANVHTDKVPSGEIRGQF